MSEDHQSSAHSSQPGTLKDLARQFPDFNVEKLMGMGISSLDQLVGYADESLVSSLAEYLGMTAERFHLLLEQARKALSPFRRKKIDDTEVKHYPTGAFLPEEEEQ